MDIVKIIRIVALAVAVVAAFVAIPYIALILAVLGLAVGFMGVPEDRRLMFLVTAVALSSVAGSLGVIPAVGSYITDILTNVSSVINAGAVAVILMAIKDRLTE